MAKLTEQEKDFLYAQYKKELNKKDSVVISGGRSYVTPSILMWENILTKLNVFEEKK